MTKLQEHIAPLNKKETNFLKTLKKQAQILPTIFHSLVPHKIPEGAKEEIKSNYFPATTSTNNTFDKMYYDASLEMYKESKERIKSVEEKAFKLLTYISALSAILFFFLGKEVQGTASIIVYFSIVILVIAVIISLRCIGVKTQKALFIDSLLDFNSTNIQTMTPEKITANILNCAVYNQGVADNSADILRAARYFLSIGIFTTLVSLGFFLFDGGSRPMSKPQQVQVSFLDSTFLDSIMNKLDLQNRAIYDLSEGIKLNSENEINRNKILDEINSSIKKTIPKKTQTKKTTLLTN